MSELTDRLAKVEANFTASKAHLEEQLANLKKQLEEVPAGIKAQIEKCESLIHEVATTLHVVQLVQKSEDFLKHVEEAIAAKL